MRIIDVIENHCGCVIVEVSAEFRGGNKLLYSKAAQSGKIFVFTFQSGGVTTEVKYQAKEKLSRNNEKFLKDMISCLIENQEPWNLSDALAQMAEISTGNISLEELIGQTLNTLICSHLFDKAAVMFFNEKLMEVRGAGIAGVPPYTEDQTAYFKTVRIPVHKEILAALADESSVPVKIEDRIFIKVDKVELKNNLILCPMITGQKIYGVLVTYSESPYDERHLYASKNTARFITAMLSAVIVYNKYQFALSSEKELSQTIKENETLLSLGNYAATIAHEIKNPLISIGGFAQRLMKAISDPNLQKMAKIITTESQRLERLTEDILSYSKKHETVKSSVPLLEEMETVKMLFDARSRESNISIILHIPEDIKISVDRNQFRQVAVNLIANAMNAIGSGGTVSVDYEEGDCVNKLTISDTGSGIPEANLPSLFKPFFTTFKNGTGLGLAISKKIMINHGGDITVRNGDKGAEFTLVIPK